MFYNTPPAVCKPIEATTRSSENWRQWWREQSAIDGTGWKSLDRQHCEAWRKLRLRAEFFTTGLGTAPW
jgi:hypothetical protein